jgi:hypothetical protein
MAAILQARSQILIDLLLVPYVIAGCEDIGSKLEEFLANSRRDAEAARRILHIDYEELDFVGLDEVVEMFANDLASRAAEDIADEENLHLSG